MPDKAKVIEYRSYGGSMKFVIAYPRGGEYKFTGGTVFDTREAAELALPRDLAFTENFWARQLAHSENAVVIDGKHYRTEPVPAGSPAHTRGFGGRVFKIRDMNTGEVTICGNLWFQGEIPDWARDVLVDTHEFVTD